jgi:DNA polymerase-3 subunit epsilon
MPDAAFQVHGLSIEFLRDKPFFADICDEFLTFVGDAPLIAHNAMFDLGFINAELERCKKAALQRERLVDTLMLARRRYPAGPNGLDHLCARFSIDTSRRTKHGALLDAELLAEVYVELTGKRQARLGLIEAPAGVTQQIIVTVRSRPAPLAPRVTDAELAAHRAFVATLGEKAIWKDYWSDIAA